MVVFIRGDVGNVFTPQGDTFGAGGGGVHDEDANVVMFKDEGDIMECGVVGIVVVDVQGEQEVTRLVELVNIILEALK